jgi:hypothetical protein
MPYKFKKDIFLGNTKNKQMSIDLLGAKFTENNCTVRNLSTNSFNCCAMHKNDTGSSCRRIYRSAGPTLLRCRTHIKVFISKVRQDTKWKTLGHPPSSKGAWMSYDQDSPRYTRFKWM